MEPSRVRLFTGRCLMGTRRAMDLGEDELLTPEQVAHLIKKSRRFVVREFKRTVPPVKIGKELRWWLSEVLQALADWTEDRPERRRTRPPKDWHGPAKGVPARSKTKRS